MKRVTTTGLRLTLGMLALSFVVPALNVHAQDQWVTLPDGRQIGAGKNAPLFYSYTTENGKTKVLQMEDPREVVNVIVTLKDQPLAFYLKKNVLQKRSLASVQSSLQTAHSSVRSKISSIAQQLSPNTNFRYQFKIRREYFTAINGIALECNRGMIRYIRSLPEVKKVQADEKVEAYLTQSVHQIRADIVQDSLGYKGDSVLVGEIDTGIDYDNPALGGGFGPGFRVIGGYDFANNDNDPMDDHGHGTHVAGIIGANGSKGLRGVAPNVKFLAVKALDKDGGGRMSDVIAGVEYCMDPDGNPATDDAVDVINMSLGGQPLTDSPLDDAVDNATQAGILSVVAAGNSGEGAPGFVNPYGGYTTISSPGTAVSALTVGACDSAYTMAAFSSKGPDRIHFAIKPEVVAPGVGILSTILDNATASWSGTSMATPHVTGVAALLKQQHRDWSPEQLKAAIVNSTKPLKNPVYPCVQGNGCVDALNAATLGLSVEPGTVDFGIVDLTVDVWKDTVEFKVRNLRNTSQNINLEVGDGLPAGVELNLSQTSFTLAPVQEKMVSAVITVPKSVSILDYAPYVYTGNIICRSDSDRVQVPFGVNKINTLVVDCDREAWEVMLYDHQSTAISIPEMYGADYKYIVPMYAGTFDLFAILHASDELGPVDTFYCISRRNVSTKGYNHISLSYTEASFSAFNHLDQVQDILGNPVGGLDTCGILLDIEMLPNSSFSISYGFLFYTPRIGRWYFGTIDSSSSATVIQEIFSLQGDQALLLRTVSSGVKSQSDLNLLSGPGDLGDLHLKFRYPASSITAPFIETNTFQYFPGFNADFVLNAGYPLPGLQEIHFMSNKYAGTFNPMKYYSLSAGIGAFGDGPDNAPTWELSTSDFTIDQGGNFVFFERRPFRPDPNECVHLQTLPSGDTVSVEEAAPSPTVQVPKFQFSYPNDRSELSVMQYTPNIYDDGGVISSDGLHAKILKHNSTYTQQFIAQMFSKNSLLQGGSSLDGGASLYYIYNVNRYTDRCRLLAETSRYKLLGQYGVSTIDYEFIVRPVPHQDCVLPSLDFFQILGDSTPTRWLHPDQDGSVHLIVCDPKGNVDSVGISLLEADGTEIGLHATHPAAKEYFASVPKNIADGFHDVIASVHDTEGNTFRLIASPAFYSGPEEDSIQYDARLRLKTYTLDNLSSVHFNAGDTLKYTLGYTNYGNFPARNVLLHFPRTGYFTPAGDSVIVIDSIGYYRGDNTYKIPLKLVFQGKKQPGDLLTYYTPSVGWKSNGRFFSRKHSILVDFSGASVGITEIGDVVPKEYSLSQNYPNPFNPTTAISYQLSAVSRVTLKIYDVLGREVAILVNCVQRPGVYSVQFDGSRFASGVYFYRLQAEGFSATKKFLLLK